jgi:hypothetical protein
VLLALSLLAGCVVAPPLAPAADAATGTPAVSAYAPPPTVTPYPTPVPRVVLTDYPAPPTNTPWPTATATPTPPLPPPVHGYGDLPELITSAQGAADGTLALYRVAGDTAWPLTLLPGTRWGHNAVIGLRVAPGGAFAAYLRGAGDYSDQLIEVVRLSDGQRTVVATLSRTPARGVAPSELALSVVQGADPVRYTLAAWSRAPWAGGGTPTDELGPPVWLDAEHLAYTQVKWSQVPGAGSGQAPEPGVPLNLLTDIWSVSIDGRSRELLATAAVYRLHGVSAGGETLYATRLLPGYQDHRFEGFARVHLPGGAVENLWPADDESRERYLGFTLVTLPDGSPRLLYSVAGRGDTCPPPPAVIWLADPISRSAQAIWTLGGPDADGPFACSMPGSFLWSPQATGVLLYQDGAAVWRLDVEARQAAQLPITGSLLSWRPEGIVTQDISYGPRVLRLWSETGELLGEIDFPNASP